MAAFSGIPIVVSGLLAVKQRIDILKETDQNCKYLYPLLENLIPILQRFTGEDAPLIIRPLEEVVKELEELFISFELPSMKERMKQFIAQPAKTRKLDSICKKLTVALLSMLTCMLQNNLGITNDLKTAITHIYEELENSRPRLTQEFEITNSRIDELQHLIQQGFQGATNQTHIDNQTIVHGNHTTVNGNQFNIYGNQFNGNQFNIYGNQFNANGDQNFYYGNPHENHDSA